MGPVADLGDDEVGEVVRAGYDAIADRYALYAAAGPNHLRRDWVEHLLARLPSGSDVLELGCGPGVPTAATLATAGHRVVGVDISGAQIALARERVPTGTFIHADLLDLSPRPGSYDGVVALYSLIHVPRRRYPEIFSRIRDWLAPHGWLLASFGTSDSPGWLEEDLLGFGAPNWTNSYDPSTTRRLLIEAGFALNRVEVVVQDEPTGPERWLYVLAQPDTARAA